MITDSPALIHIVRSARRYRPLGALAFTLMLMQIGEPCLDAAQDKPAGGDRSSPAAPAGPAEPLRRPGTNAPAAGPGRPAITLDQAVERLARTNLTLAARWLEVVQARDDLIRAGQRPNSLLFLGGGNEGIVQLQPFEFAPKLWARSLSAHAAVWVIEAQYRDAVRRSTAELYTAYVDMQEAGIQTRYARVSIARFESLLDRTETPRPDWPDQ